MLEASLQYNTFVRDHEEVEAWIEQKQKTLDDNVLNIKDFKDKVKKLQAHQAFESEVIRPTDRQTALLCPITGVEISAGLSRLTIIQLRLNVIYPSGKQKRAGDRSLSVSGIIHRRQKGRQRQGSDGQMRPTSGPVDEAVEEHRGKRERVGRSEGHCQVLRRCSASYGLD